VSDEGLVLLREILAGQRALTSQVQALHAAVERERPRRPEPDVAAIASLREIFAALGGDFLFTTGDLIEHAALPECAKLHAALVAATGSPLRARRVGKWLRWLSGRDLGGLLLERVDEDRYGAQWALRELRELTPNSLPERSEARKMRVSK